MRRPRRRDHVVVVPRATSPRRRGERGFTLIEVLITLSILGIIGAVIPAAMSVGIRTLGTKETQGHLTASHDVLSLQKALADDLSRATCISNGTTQVPQSPLCISLPSSSCSGTGLILCVGFRDIAGSGSCHLDVYRQQTNAANGQASIVRNESVAASGGLISASNVTVLGGGTTVQTASITAEEQGESPSWGDMVVSVKVIRGVDTATLVLQPFTADPVLSQVSPC